MEIDFKLIGERIKEIRKRKGYSQERLSEEMDVTVAYISRVERGKAEINLKRLTQISWILGTPLEELITGIMPNSKHYLDKELNEILKTCSPEKQKLIYNIAKIVAGLNFN